MLRNWLILSVVLFPVVHSFTKLTTASESLDVLLQDLALRALLHHRPHTTGALYEADLPENLKGMEMSVVRLRSMTVWRRGANFSNIHIPQMTLPVPYVRRISIVWLDFGNWSSSYFHNVKGYSMLSSVVGFMAFDASNVSSTTINKLDLNTVGRLIEIQLPSLQGESNRKERCARFSANGTVHISEMSMRKSLCHSTNLGFFAIVVPLERKKQRVWDLWVKGFVFGFIGVVVVWFLGMVIVKVVLAKKIHEMEREADESIGLETIWIGTSKMPSAAVTRTHPVLENATNL